MLAFHGAPGAIGRTHATALKIGNDLPVAPWHRSGQGLADFAKEELLSRRVFCYLLDGLVQRGAEDLGAQRIPVRVGPAMTKQRAHVARQLAQLGGAMGGEPLADALERNAFFDLTFVDQTDRCRAGAGVDIGGPRPVGPCGNVIFDTFPQGRDERCEKDLLILEKMELHRSKATTVAVSACGPQQDPKVVRRLNAGRFQGRLDQFLRRGKGRHDGRIGRVHAL